MHGSFLRKTFPNYFLPCSPMPKNLLKASAILRKASFIIFIIIKLLTGDRLRTQGHLERFMQSHL